MLILQFLILQLLFSCATAFINKSPLRFSVKLPTNYARQKLVNNKLRYKTFDEFLESMELPVLVDFYAEWCGPCKMMQPVLEDVANRLDSEAKIAKVDTDKSPRLGNRFQVEALPTLVLFDKGQEIERFMGYRGADELENEIRNVSLVIKMKNVRSRILTLQ